jgi:P-type E1-E2 ATPase
MDKTGTITKGKPELAYIKNMSTQTDTDIIAIFASLESHSEHPIGHTIVAYANANGVSLKKVDHFESIKGKGLKGVVDGEMYYVGNMKLLSDLHISFEVKHIEKEIHHGKTPAILTDGKKVLAIAIVEDTIKPEAKETIHALHTLKKKVVLLTGDTKPAALHIGKLVGIDEVIAEVLPEDKLRVIKEFQSKGSIVAMVGDGVNDAPALAQANIGIAMGTGTDVAIDSAGITLLKGDISKLVKAIKISQMTMRGIHQNLFWAFVYNLIGIPVAAGLLYPITGFLLHPAFAGIAMAFSSVSVVANSLRIRSMKM